MVKMALFEKKFLTELGGGLLSGMIDAALEAYFVANPEMANKFLYVPTVEPLPPADDWIVVGVSAVPYIYGKYGRKATAERIGGGALKYGAAMILHHIPVRAKWMVK